MGPPLLSAEGTDFKEGMDLNLQYLMMLEPDRLLYCFRRGAAPGQAGSHRPHAS